MVERLTALSRKYMVAILRLEIASYTHQNNKSSAYKYESVILQLIIRGNSLPVDRWARSWWI